MDNLESNIPIVIICFNNHKYVDMMIKQIEKINTNQSIIVLNNNSNCPRTVHYLKGVNHKVIYLDANYGHNVWKKPEIYNTLPNQFIITDPDIKFNTLLPFNYIHQMIQLSHKYKSCRIGFALDISDKHDMLPYHFYDFGFHGIPTIWDSQLQYWNNKLPDQEYELYQAEIDTTFALHTKSYNENHIRRAGNFTAKHMPWYKHDENMSLLERYLMYYKASGVSSIKGFTLKHIEECTIIVNKRGIPLLFEKNVTHNEWWSNTYENWENETFEVFDKYLNKKQPFLDIGAWMGTTAIYASMNSSYVVAVECDPVSVERLKANILLNKLDTVIDIETFAIYSDTTEVSFGPNAFSDSSKLNDSMSQIKLSSTNKDHNIKTITFESIIKKYNLSNLSLIKVDIEGGEEYILMDVYNYGLVNKTPLYISFHHCWWNDKNLDRFHFLNNIHKQQIHNNPFCPILFEF
jgi:FkbM family methyltransferase